MPQRAAMRPVGLAVRPAPAAEGIPTWISDPEAAERLFLAGARGALGLPADPAPLSDPLSTPARQRRMADARAALEQGQQAYLDLHLGAAERHLATAMERLMEDPSALAEAGVAIDVILLLAQVRITQQRFSEADRILTRGVLAFPRFPGAEHPPAPEVQVRLDALMTRLKPELTGGLMIRSTPPGLSVWINGVSVGQSPIKVGELPARPFRVRLRRGDELVGSRLVEPEEGGALVVDFDIGGSRARAALTGEIAGLSRPVETWALSQAFAGAVEADEICLGLIDERPATRGAYALRLDPDRRRVVGGHRRAIPDSPSAWKALGALCAPGVPGALSLGELQSALWGEQIALDDGAEGGSGRAVWGWSAVGTGAAAGVVGAIFGAQALQSQDDFERAGSPSLAEDAADRARRQALIGDVSYAVSVGLVATGIYLLLTDR